MTIKRIKTGPRLSAAVVHGDSVYLAGQVDESGDDAEEQTRRVLGKIDALLAEAGTDKSNIVYANVWLADIADFDRMNAVWDAWVVPGKTPARACVESRLARPRCRVEIAVVASLTGG
jgi:enamine deaminase RidA (YjgF/YER057c/UK114 family)